MGCSNLTGIGGPPELGVPQRGKCSLGGSPVLVFTFADGRSQKDWLDATEGFHNYYLVTGKGWAVVPFSRALELRIQGKLGGTIIDHAPPPGSPAPL